MKISQLGEVKLIERIFKKKDKLINQSDNIVLDSYHDDAALQVNTDKYTVLSTDMLIAHSHFPVGMTYYQMGEKIVTVNVSDILACNAKPESILLSMGLPEDLLVSQFDEIIDGVLDKCLEYDVKLIGGDINQNSEIILSATSTGQAGSSIKLQRSIEEDDLVAVTGLLGSPAAALDLLGNSSTSLDDKGKERIISSLLEPDLPVGLSKFFREHPDGITSMTDITDGLAVELGCLSSKNEGIGFLIYEDKLPYNRDIKRVAGENNKQLNEYLLHFGEEFELLLTLNSNYYEKHAKDLKDIYIIGKVNKTNQIKLLSKNNTIKDIDIRGYEHLKD